MLPLDISPRPRTPITATCAGMGAGMGAVHLAASHDHPDRTHRRMYGAQVGVTCSGVAPRRSAGLLLYRQRHRRPTGTARAHGRPLLGPQGRGVLVDPQGRAPRRRGPGGGRRREFTEELGLPAPVGDWQPLGDVRTGSKAITAWAVEADLDASRMVPGTFTLEWPPRSGRQQQFPELDRVEWLDLDTARVKLVMSQRPLLDRLLDLLARQPG